MNRRVWQNLRVARRSDLRSYSGYHDTVHKKLKLLHINFTWNDLGVEMATDSNQPLASLRLIVIALSRRQTFGCYSVPRKASFHRILVNLQRSAHPGQTSLKTVQRVIGNGRDSPLILPTSW
jgi:hypothetical protein